jgi:hypothetical protein
VHADDNVMRTEMHTAEPLVPEPSYFDFEIAIEKLKDINRQVVTKLWHEWSKPEVTREGLRSTTLSALST